MSPWELPTNESTFNAKEAVNDSWMLPVQAAPSLKPDFADNEELKRAFGAELAKGQDAFKAGMAVFENQMPKALWVSSNWLNDPVVIASKDAYLQTLASCQKPLDKEQLLAKILAFHDEKDDYGRPLVEAKERLNALKLYSEVMGYTGKINIDASTNTTNNSNNFTKIILVKPDDKEDTAVIDQTPNDKSRMLNDRAASIPLKLVGGVSR